MLYTQKHIRLTVFLTLISLSQNIWSQKTKDTLNTEIIQIVKSYNPTISDANKVSEKIVINNDSIVPIDKIEYKINSIPVASTFIPEKGKAQNLEPISSKTYYDSYVKAGFGNYSSPLLDAYISTPSKNKSKLGISAYHHSAQDGIKNVTLDNSYYKTLAGLYFDKITDNQTLKIGTKLKHQLFHWYGLSKTHNFNTDDLNKIKTRHQYYGINAFAEITQTNESFFNGANLNINYFRDNFKSHEQRLKLKPKFNFPLADQYLFVDLILDYLKGNSSIPNQTNEEYGIVKIGLNPKYQYNNDELSFTAGIKTYLNYENNQLTENSSNSFEIFPDLYAAYKISGNFMIAYLGAVGDLTLNSYEKHTNINPYLSSDFISRTTKENYQIFGGVKGFATNEISYNIKGYYSNIYNLPMYKLTANKELIPENIYTDNESFISAFNIVYDKANIFGIYAKSEIKLLDLFNIGGIINYKYYNMDNELEAWNLPNIEANIFGDFTYEEFEVNGELLFKDRTFDSLIDPYYTANDLTLPSNKSDYNVKNKPITDMNLKLAYHISEQFNVFVSAHNIFSKNYESLYNYPQQGFQIIGGAVYKFSL